MKRHIILFLFAIMTLMATSCENIEQGINVPENDYAVDIEKFVSATFFDISGTETVALSTKSPFAVTVLSGKDYAVNKDVAAGKFTIYPYEIPQSKYNGEMLSLTRDITLYVRPFEMQTVTGFGYFEYPVRIRQRGADGTVYLTADDIRAWQENHSVNLDWGGEPGQRYILGTIAKIGDMHVEEGIYDGIAYCGELWQVPATQKAYPEPQTLDVVEIEIDVDGATLTAKVHYPSCYKLVSKSAYKTGDKIEMSFPNHGMVAGDNTLWVSPLDILVVK